MAAELSPTSTMDSLCSSPSDYAKHIAEAEEANKSGNECYKESKFGQALACYYRGVRSLMMIKSEDAAIEAQVRTQMQKMLTNRALMHIKMENYGVAVLDAGSAIELARTKATRSKAYFRRGAANLFLNKYDLAVKDFRAALKLCPEDKVLTEQLSEASKLLAQQKFAAAIAVSSGVRLSTSIDLDSYTIDRNYEGPVYDGTPDCLSPEFFSKFLDYLTAKPENRLPKKCILHLALDIINCYKTQPNVVEIDVPMEDSNESITVVGDVHGQFYDLVAMFKRYGWPSASHRYIFNGDFVDRGSFSVEVITSLYLAKLIWPSGMYLTRGNHESRRTTKLYGFEGEMKIKASSTIYQVYCESFDCLPLAHCINKRIFVVHGGLSAKTGVTIKHINALDRFRDDEDEGLMTDLLWADPQEEPGSQPSRRGISRLFGPDITEDFLKTNNFDLIIRSHEVKDAGYEFNHGGKLITVFSAPNYCDQMMNKGSVITFSGPALATPELTPHIRTFENVPHPPVQAMQYANPIFLGMQ